jgi:hypothetical protein
MATTISNSNKIRALQLRRAENVELLEVTKRIMGADAELGNHPSQTVTRVALETAQRIQRLDSQIDEELAR